VDGCFWTSAVTAAGAGATCATAATELRPAGFTKKVKNPMRFIIFQGDILSTRTKTQFRPPPFIAKSWVQSDF
jgi:hypothetical protein